MLTPYFQDDQTTLYLGDSCEVFPQLGHVDAIVTDPPYGIGESSKKARTRSKVFGGRLIKAGQYHDFDWDKEPPPAWLLDCMINRSDYQIIFGGNYFGLPSTSCYLVWDKDNGKTDFADCELAWTNLKRAVRKIKYRWSGILQEPGKPKEFRLYPTQKPIAVMDWALGWLPTTVQTVVDPFCGSGSTLIAARSRGLKAVGIDNDVRALDIAIKTLTGTQSRYRYVKH